VVWYEAVREAWRNVVTGAAHATVWAGVLVVLTVVLGGVDANAVRTIVADGIAFREKGAATWVLDAPGMVDGAACDALAGVREIRAAGAVSQERDGVATTVLPRTPIPQFAVTPGLSEVLQVRTPEPGLGVWVSADVAARYGTGWGDQLATPDGIVRVDGVYDFPDDGRDTALGFAALSPTPARDRVFDECWFTVWPMSDSAVALARTALVPTRDPSQASQIRFHQLNSSLGAAFTGLADFQDRLSRFAPWAALVFSIALGFAAYWSRRLEHASALHAGLPKSFLLLEGVVEAAIWAMSGLVVATPLLLFVAAKAVADHTQIALLGARSMVTGFAGVMIGTALGVWTVRESRLFALFKNR